MNIERKLASIRAIKSVSPIENADNIVQVSIDGWNVVTQKSNNFKVGDLVCYFEIDSLLPVIEDFEFLRPNCYVKEANSVNGEGFRIKSIKLRGVISQGLILPISQIKKFLTDEDEFFDGMDVTDYIGVKKYEKPIPANLAGKVKGNFPDFIRKTDQPRIQNVYHDLNDNLKNDTWEATIKLDGSSFTSYYNNGEFGVCSRNLDLFETDDNSFWRVVRDTDLENKLKLLNRNVAIQGEIIGPGIQSNQEKLSKVELYVFDIFDIDEQRYFTSKERLELTDVLGLNHAPILELAIHIGSFSLEEILKYAEGPSLNSNSREGVVFKNNNDPSISFKAISNKWLIKND